MAKKELLPHSIGFFEDFKEEELAGKHVDGVTGAVFKTEEDYRAYADEVRIKKETEEKEKAAE